AAVSGTTAFRLVEWGTTPYYAPVCAVRPGWVEMSDFTRTGSPTPCDDLRREPSAGAVEAQLGRLEAGQHDRLGRVRGVGHEERQLLALDAREVAQHEVRGVHAPGRAADPDAHPHVVAGAEGLAHVAQPVVPPFAPTLL